MSNKPEAVIKKRDTTSSGSIEAPLPKKQNRGVNYTAKSAGFLPKVEGHLLILSFSKKPPPRRYGVTDREYITSIMDAQTRIKRVDEEYEDIYVFPKYRQSYRSIHSEDESSHNIGSGTDDNQSYNIRHSSSPTSSTSDSDDKAT
jgi:hypothetical protein